MSRDSLGMAVNKLKIYVKVLEDVRLSGVAIKPRCRAVVVAADHCALSSAVSRKQTERLFTRCVEDVVYYLLSENRNVDRLRHAKSFKH